MKIFTISFFVCLLQISLLRWKVRLFEGTDNGKEGMLPAEVLDTQHSGNSLFGDKADDAAYRRE